MSAKTHIARDSGDAVCARLPEKAISVVNKEAFKALPKEQQCRRCARKLPFLAGEPNPYVKNDTTEFAKELGALFGLK